ncbi:LamG-like jellyroll fold domain-containing protein [Kribbella sp. NPDC056951]|uniref:LamG-like jellyroll fold domain-containing protein n=1 Tax=Kribbella sp. NPDC056951 TaxID=3345978 RepID=UPI00362AB7F9
MAQAAGYSFNPETVWGDTVRDLAGYGLHGKVVGSATIVPAKYGDGLNCTGGALRIVAEDDTYPTNTDGGISLAAWVRLNNNTAAARCLVSVSSDDDLNVALYASNAAGHVEAWIEGTTYATTTSIRDGAEHHVMLVVNRTTGPGDEWVKIVVDGTVVLSETDLTLDFDYAGEVTVEVGRNVIEEDEALNGVVDDFRWWNDPIETSYWATIVGQEQIDLQLAIYPFDNEASDRSIYGRHLIPTASAAYTYGMYGRALVSSASQAGASGPVNLPDCDRLAITGWVRLDVVPSSPEPILAIDDLAGNSRVRVVVNADRTVTATWVTIAYGTKSVTSTAELVHGEFVPVHISMNPTYVGIRIGSLSQQTTSTGNGFPHLTPTVNGLKVLYVGGDKNTGGEVTWNYLTLTKNFLREVADTYWAGPPTNYPSRPLNIARLVVDFNENGGTTVKSKSPAASPLTRTSAGSWIQGVHGAALAANGSGGSATGSIDWPENPKGWAFSAWVRCREEPSGARFLVLRNEEHEVAHAGRLWGNLWTRLFGADGNTGAISISSAPIPHETWIHVAASCNGQRTQFFLNGERVTALTYDVGALRVPTQIVIGGDGDDDSVADMDSLRLFDTPVSPANIAWMYQNPGQFYDTEGAVLL